MIGLAVIGFLALAPVLAFVGALLRALFLFWPTMVFLGALHSYIPAVPPLGWQASFFLVAVLGLLIPTGTTTSKSD